MKIMTQEEKAKVYDEALAKVANCSTDKYGCLIGVKPFDLFPELKESEDERIRKELLEHCKNQAKPYIQTGNECPQIQSWIAWLEKQVSPDMVADAYLRGCNDTEKKLLEKHGYEVVGSKFKDGDWVVRGNITAQILDVQEQYYVGIDTNGNDFTSSRFLSDDKIHLWTIDDAKDDDVLVDEDNNIGIYRGKVDDVDWHSYIYLGCDNYVRCGGYHIIKNTKPATKEQCDQLEKAIADSDFTFDFKKKKLKIEKEYDGEDYGIDSLFHAQRILEKTLGEVDGYQTDDGILSHKCAISAVKKLYEKKSAWSEDDEKRAESLHGWLDTLVNYIHHDVTVSLDLRRERMQQVEQLKTWLKPIKDRYNWKPSDVQMRILSIYADQNNTHGSVLTSLYNDLKKLREE